MRLLIQNIIVGVLSSIIGLPDLQRSLVIVHYFIDFGLQDTLSTHGKLLVDEVALDHAAA